MTNSVNKKEQPHEEGDENKAESAELEQFIHKKELQNKILKKISEKLKMPVHVEIKNKDSAS